MSLSFRRRKENCKFNNARVKYGKAVIIAMDYLSSPLAYRGVSLRSSANQDVKKSKRMFFIIKIFCLTGLLCAIYLFNYYSWINYSDVYIWKTPLPVLISAITIGGILGGVRGDLSEYSPGLLDAMWESFIEYEKRPSWMWDFISEIETPWALKGIANSVSIAMQLQCELVIIIHDKTNTLLAYVTMFAGSILLLGVFPLFCDPRFLFGFLIPTPLSIQDRNQLFKKLVILFYTFNIPVELLAKLVDRGFDELRLWSLYSLLVLNLVVIIPVFIEIGRPFRKILKRRFKGLVLREYTESGWVTIKQGEDLWNEFLKYEFDEKTGYQFSSVSSEEFFRKSVVMFDIEIFDRKRLRRLSLIPEPCGVVSSQLKFDRITRGAYAMMDGVLRRIVWLNHEIRMYRFESLDGLSEYDLGRVWPEVEEYEPTMLRVREVFTKVKEDIKLLKGVTAVTLSDVSVRSNVEDILAMGVLLRRFFQINSLEQVQTFIVEFYLLVLRDFNVSEYLVAISQELSDIFMQGFTFTMDAFASISPLAIKMAKLIGYAIVGPLFYFIGRRFMPSNHLVEYMFMGVTNMEGAVDAAISLFKLVVANPVYLVTGSVCDIRMFAPPTYTLYTDMLEMEDKIARLQIDSIPEEYDKIIIELRDLDSVLKMCMTSHKLTIQEVATGRVLGGKIQARISEVIRRKNLNDNVVNPVVIEFVSARTNIGKTHITRMLAEDLLHWKGYRNVSNMVYHMTDQKFDEAASSSSKVLLCSDPNSIEKPPDPQTTQLYKINRIAGGEHEFISKASVEAKQQDKWEPWFILISCNEHCLNKATKILSIPAQIGRRVKYSVSVTLNSRYSTMDEAISAREIPNHLWVFNLYVWDFGQDATGYIPVWKDSSVRENLRSNSFNYDEILTFLAVQHEMENYKFMGRCMRQPNYVCSKCVQNQTAICKHIPKIPFREDYMESLKDDLKSFKPRDHKLPRESLGRRPVSDFKLPEGEKDDGAKVDGEIPPESFVPTLFSNNNSVLQYLSPSTLMFLALSAYIGWFYAMTIVVFFFFSVIFIALTPVIAAIVRGILWVHGVQNALIMKRENLLASFRMHKYQIIGLFAAMTTAVISCRVYLMSKPREEVYEPTMFNNHEIPKNNPGADKTIKTLYPKASMGVQDLKRWVRKHIHEKIVKIQVNLESDTYGTQNYATGFMIKGNRLLACAHVLKKERCAYKLLSKGGEIVYGINKILETTDVTSLVTDCVMVYNSDVLPVVDSGRFLLPQQMVHNTTGSCVLAFMDGDSVVYLPASYIFHSNGKIPVKCGDLTVMTYYNVDKCVPTGASGGICYSIENGKPFILGGIIGSSAGLGKTLVIPWIDRDINIDDRFETMSVPPIPDNYDEIVEAVGKIELDETQRNYANEWGTRSSLVANTVGRAGVNRGELVSYDQTGAWRVRLSELTEIDVPKFVKPPLKINGVSAIDAHIQNQPDEDSFPDHYRIALAELMFKVNEKRFRESKMEGPFISNVEALRGKSFETLPLSSLALSTSSGFPSGGSKRNHVILAPLPDDEHNFVLTDELSDMAGLLEGVLDSNYIVPTPMCIGLKAAEPRKEGKPMRVFFFMNMVMTILTRKYVFPVLSLIIGEFMQTGVAIGGVTFNEDVVLMLKSLAPDEKKRKNYAADGKHFDMSHFRQNCQMVLRLVELIFEAKNWSRTDYLKFKRFYLSVVFFAFWRKDCLLYMACGMASGVPVTTVINCVMNLFCILLWCLMTAKKRITASEELNVEASRLYANVGKLLYGDDEVVSVLEEDEMSIDDYVQASKMLGYIKQSANKSDKIEPEELFEGVEFLKRTFKVVEFRDKEYAVMVLNFVSIYKMLFFREPKTTITEMGWFDQVFDNAQFEVAFHGQDVYERLHEFFMAYKIEFGVKAEIKEWSYWMEKFLSGVAPYQYNG